MEGERRPDPEALLQMARQSEELQDRGRLKIFFGYAAGVGKTYGMLQAAREAKKSGRDVVVGYIEPHARPETMNLLKGLEIMEPLSVNYKGITLKEFNLDQALLRRPQLILVDELAHTNAEGCRHRKRYQDVEELLKAGIDVYTTVNVQHLESINDIVAAITGVVVKERIPDSVFDGADKVELVDIEPDDLIRRLNEGKVYRSNQADRALAHFFIKENLAALRELALRRTADRVNRTAEKTEPKTHCFYTEEHILICLSSSPSNGKVIRTAARMAEVFHGTFTALYVENSRTEEADEKNDPQFRENVRLAEQLGAKIATVYGEDIPSQIVEYARVSGVSKIVIGRPKQKKILFSRNQNLVERLIAQAPALDIYIIPDSLASYNNSHSKRRIQRPDSLLKFSLIDLMKTVCILAAVTGIGALFDQLGFTEANIITIYILGVLVTSAVTEGFLYGLAASLASVFTFNFFFTEPRFTFRAYDAGYPVTFLVMFLASFLTSTITMRSRKQAREAAGKAFRTEILLETSQKLQKARTAEEILRQAGAQLKQLFHIGVIVYPVLENGGLGRAMIFPEPGIPAEPYVTPDEQAVADWVYRNHKHAGATTDTLPGAKCLYLAVRNREEVYAVIGIAFDRESKMEAFDKNILIAMLGEIALAMEKDKMLMTKNRIEAKARQEQLRSNLLRVISHDLRTPLTSISGNAGILMENGRVLDEEKKQRLYTDIYEDAIWLVRLVENLLSVTRIENGTMELRKEPEVIQDVVEEALGHISRRVGRHILEAHYSNDFLMARMDSGLIIQVIINLIDNAVKYTPEGSRIEIGCFEKNKRIYVEISDDGPGIPEESKKRLFDMFYTVDNKTGDGRRGMGLGLSLCKSIISAHGGEIQVRDNEPKGTVFSFYLEAVPLDSLAGILKEAEVE